MKIFSKERWRKPKHRKGRWSERLERRIRTNPFLRDMVARTQFHRKENICSWLWFQKPEVATRLSSWSLVEKIRHLQPADDELHPIDAGRCPSGTPWWRPVAPPWHSGVTTCAASLERRGKHRYCSARKHTQWRLMYWWEQRGLEEQEHAVCAVDWMDEPLHEIVFESEPLRKLSILAPWVSRNKLIKQKYYNAQPIFTYVWYLAYTSTNSFEFVSTFPMLFFFVFKCLFLFLSSVFSIPLFYHKCLYLFLHFSPGFSVLQS